MKGLTYGYGPSLEGWFKAGGGTTSHSPAVQKMLDTRQRPQLNKRIKELEQKVAVLEYEKEETKHSLKLLRRKQADELVAQINILQEKLRKTHRQIELYG